MVLPLVLFVLGAVLSIPMGVLAVASTRGGTNMLVVSADATWVLAALPVAGALGVLLIGISLWIGLNPQRPRS